MPIDGISLAPWQLEQRTDFTGGENIRLVPGLVAKSQIILGQNCELSPEGLLRTRLGKRKLLTTPIGAGGVLGVWTFGTTAGTNYLIVHHGTSIYAGEWDGTSQDPTLTEIKTGLTANARFNVEVWKDNIFFANGNDAIFRFDGTTTTTLLDSPPLSYLVKVYEGRLYVVDAANPNLLRYSGLEDYDDWHGLNVINVRDGDGDEIKNILPVNGGMALVKTRNIFILYGTNKDNFKLNAMPASGAAGATGYFSGNDGGIVLGRDSWFTVQTNGVKPVGITHSPLLQDMTLDQLADTTAVAQKRYLRGYYLLGNGERTIVMMDGKSGAIFRWTGLDAGAIGVADCEGFDDDILIGDADEGTVYILDNETDDDGDPIDTIIKTPYIELATRTRKVWRYFWPRINMISEKLGAVDIYMGHDAERNRYYGLGLFKATSVDVMVWGEDNWGEAYWGRMVPIEDKYWINGMRAVNCSFRIATTARIELTGYAVKFREAGPL